jgi:hypothetical protein
LLQQRSAQAHTIHTIHALVLSFLVDVLELAQSLDDVDVVLGPYDNMLGAFVQAVVQHFESLQHVSPILALVVQPFVEHVHDLEEIRSSETCSRVSSGLTARAHTADDVDNK